MSRIACLARSKPARCGSIPSIRYGDLIAVAGDPLKYISVLQSVAVVIKGGQVVRQAAAR
jgi:imidazolonepropionase-like amidohydrolase